MNKFIVVLVGLFAMGSATIIRTYPSAAILRSVIPTVVPAVELSDWEAYKAKFGKSYYGIEDRFRRNVYFANKDKVAKYDELLKYGLEAEKLALDSLADFTLEEMMKLRSLEDDKKEEWDRYKEKYNKAYDSFEDKFRETIYFIMKDIIEAHNKLAESGFVSYKMLIDLYTDYFKDELPSSAYVLPTATAPLPFARYAYPYAAYPYASYPYATYPAVRSVSPFVYDSYSGLYPVIK